MLKLNLIYQIFKYFIYLLILITLFNFNKVIAINNKQDLIITADDLLIDNKSNISHFSGKVVVWFDNMIMQTSLVIISYKKLPNNQNTIDNIHIPNLLVAKNNQNGDIIIANEANYDAYKNSLVIQGNVRMLINDNTVVKTNKLIYHTKFKQISKSKVNN